MNRQLPVTPRLRLRVASLRLLALAAVAWLGLSIPVMAQTWTGGGTNGNWTTAGNWNPSGTPANTGAAAITFNGSARTSVNVNSAQNIATLTFSSTSSAFTLSGSAITIQNGLTSNSSNTQTISSNVSLGNSQTWNINSGTVSITGVLSDPYYMTLTKGGAGTLVLSGNNASLTGPTIVNGGTLKLTNSNSLGSADSGNQVNSGATLELNGGITYGESGVTLSGTGASSNGVLVSSAGTNNVSSQIVLGAASLFNVSAGTLNLTNSLSLDYNLEWTGSGAGVVAGSVYGSGLFTKTGTGTLTFNGTSGISNSGGLLVTSGNVVLNHTAGGNTWNGPITVGNNTAAAGTATLKLNQGQQIGDSLSVTVNQSGVFDLNGSNETIAGLNMTGGTTKTGAGILSISSAGATVVTSASANTATISGIVDVQAFSSTFDVANGTASMDLNVSAVVSSSGPGNIIKAGSGNMSFSGTAANTYAGTTTINAGTLSLNKTAAVNAISGSSVTINTGGTLLYGASNQINNTATMTLAGGTVNFNGFSEGTSSAAGIGALTLSDSSTISLGSGALVVSFANSNGSAWTAGKTLTIVDWSGSATGAGTDQIYFGTNSSGLTAGQLAQIQFLNPAGFSSGSYGAKLLSSGELVPFSAVPEPSTYAAGAGLLLVIGGDFYRRRRAALNS